MTMSPAMQGGHVDLFKIGEEARPVDGAVRTPRARSGQSPAALRETYWSATGRTARGRGTPAAPRA